ncbi:unnamed protein product, partial [Medioppia subpectinata]
MSSTARTVCLDLDALTDDELTTDCEEEDTVDDSSADAMKASDEVVVKQETEDYMINTCKVSDNERTDGQDFDLNLKPKSESKNETTEATTDTRFRKRVFDYNLIDKRTGVRMFDKKSLALIDRPTDEVESIVRHVCFHCEKRY